MFTRRSKITGVSMKKIFSNTTSISLSILIINYSLIVTLIWCIAVPTLLVYTSINPESNFTQLNITQKVLSKDIQFTKADLPNEFKLSNGTVSVNASYLLENHFYNFIIEFIWRMVLFSLFAYILWLFRKALLSVQNNAVFEEDNAKRFRLIYLILFVFWISEWITSTFNHTIFDEYFVSMSSIAIRIVDLGLGYFITSILFFTLSLVLQKAQDLHQEQKLTV
tara:strand:+ start:2289 stop:2957 length:669 start_codon:yes stop_codon:yes gene_type:complete